MLLAVYSCVSGADESNGKGGLGDSSAIVKETPGIGEFGAITDTAENKLSSAGLRGSSEAGRGAGEVSRVVILGTSLTAGLGLAPEQAYPALLQAKADSAGYRVRVVNAGLSGETSAGALRRVSWVLADPAVLVVLEVGANDGLRGVDPDSLYGNLVKLVAAVREAQPKAGIALIQMEAPTNLGEAYTKRFGAAYGRAASATGVNLWPFLLDGVAGVADLNQADGIHPNVVGERRVASNVWRSLRPALDAMGSDVRVGGGH